MNQVAFKRDFLDHLQGNRFVVGTEGMYFEGFYKDSDGAGILVRLSQGNPTTFHKLPVKNIESFDVGCYEVTTVTENGSDSFKKWSA